jgi:hypothetical protein
VIRSGTEPCGHRRLDLLGGHRGDPARGSRPTTPQSCAAIASPRVEAVPYVPSRESATCARMRALARGGDLLGGHGPSPGRRRSPRAWRTRPSPGRSPARRCP